MFYHQWFVVSSNSLRWNGWNALVSSGAGPSDAGEWCTCAVIEVGGSDIPLIFQNNNTTINVVSVMSWFESIEKTGRKSWC